MKMIHTGIVLLCLLTICCIFHTIDVLSETLPKPIYKTTRPKFAEIKEEAVYQYRVMDYKGRVKLDLIKNVSDAKYDSPEEALISLFSAIYVGDYNWWLNSWKKESQLKLKEDFSQKDELIEKWESLFEDTYIALITRIETGKYVLLYYNVASKDRNKIIQRQTIAFVNEDGKWLATNELSADPVFLYWQDPNYKAFKVGRELIVE
jgi:hypothetical protein